MPGKKYILALDQGTTSSRAILFDAKGNAASIAQQEFTQIYPQPGCVEHDAEEIWQTQLKVARQVLKQHEINAADVVAIGITNQRETAVVWDRETGKPVYNAIVWQDKRTAPLCEELKKQGLEDYVRETTGLVIDSYFSGTKINWILKNVPGAEEKARAGNLVFGTIDSWLIWKLTGGKKHLTDYTNASRTLLFNIAELKWDEKMLRELEIPESMLPKVLASSGNFGETDLFFGKVLPIMGVAGDQQSALFGQLCTEPGTAKNTYGTGCFMLMNTGTEKITSRNGLVTTLACSMGEKPEYALEGSVFIAGAAVQWLRDGLKIIDDSADTEYISKKVKSSEGVYVVPAFAGLGAPYWDMDARGAVFGITRGTKKAHFVRATLESLAYQTRDIFDAMAADAGIRLKSLRVDGGVAANNLLMQFQADIMDVTVVRPKSVETTAFGAALLAGLASELYDLENLKKDRHGDKHFQPVMEETQREELYKGWRKAVKRTMGWLKEE